MLPRAWVVSLVAALVLFAGGWFAHAALDGPGPDVARLLREADSAAGERARAREDSLRRAHAAQLVADSLRADSVVRAERLRARVARARADTAALRTDAALVVLAERGAETADLAAALATERAARDSARVADSVAAAAELAAWQRRAALLVVERDRLYGRTDSLVHVVAALREGLRRASKRGLDPAATLSYGAGCNNLTVGGSVRVLGWLRGGVHIETRACH